MTSSLFYAFITSLVIGTVLTPILIVFATRIGLVDKPGGRKIHKEPVARAGGLAFAIGALVGMSVGGLGHPIINGILLGAIIILVTGSLDDYFDLPVKLKFLGQFLAAGVTAIYSQLSWQPFSEFIGYLFPQWIAIAIIIFILVLICNASNFSDGLDGLAAGLAFLSFGVIAHLAYEMNDLIVLYLTLPVMGGLLGFLRFNTFPARVFMGDGGSQFLGFFLSIAALLLTDSERNPLNPFLVPFLIGLPLLDLLAVTIERIVVQGTPFRADNRHLHHKLLAIGFTHHQVVMIMYGMQIGMITLAYILQWAPSLLLVGVYLLISTSIGLFFFSVSSGRMSTDLVTQLSRSPLYWRTWVHAAPWLSKRCTQALGLGIIMFLVFSSTISPNTALETAFTTTGLGVFLLLGLAFNTQSRPLFTRMGLYLGSAFTLYLAQEYIGNMSWNIQILFEGFFGLLILWLILSIHLDEHKQFPVNPMDYLLLFVALVIPFLPELRISNINISSLVAKLIILFFSCEVLLQAYSKKSHYLGYISAAVLLSIGIRAF